jgi:hypothetical protein
MERMKRQHEEDVRAITGIFDAMEHQADEYHRSLFAAIHQNQGL